MKKTLRVVSGVLLGLAVVAIGGATVAAAISAKNWQTALDLIRPERMLALGAGAALLCLGVLYWLAGFKPRRVQDPYITFENENGAISVSARAIGEVVSRVGEEFAAVHGLTSTVRPVGGSVEVLLDAKVRSGTQIPELCRMLQERVRELIRENLGLTEIRGVRVTVREILAPAAPKADEGVA